MNNEKILVLSLRMFRWELIHMILVNGIAQVLFIFCKTARLLCLFRGCTLKKKRWETIHFYLSYFFCCSVKHERKEVLFHVISLIKITLSNLLCTLYT